jgi:phosphatidylglycerol:prolipoprotein diacylglycerol transferase
MAEFIFDFMMSYWSWGFIGFFVASILIVRNLAKNGIIFPVAIIIITAAVYGGLLGTRVLSVLINNPQLFIYNLPQALAFWQGGLAWQGGIPVGMVAGLIVVKIARKPFWSSAGCFAPGLALAHAIGRIGCLCHGCCYGAPTTVPWAIYSKELGTLVHPTQVYSIIGELAAFVILQWFVNKKPDFRKYLILWYGIIFSTHRFIQEFFRGTPPGPELISGLRIHQVICIIIFVVSLSIFLSLIKKKWGYIVSLILVLLTAASFFVFRPQSETQHAIARSDSGLYLVITRSMFADNLAYWKAERENEGFTVIIGTWNNAPTSTNIKKWIKAQTRISNGLCRYILLVGDCAAENEDPAEWHIPSFTVPFDQGKQTVPILTDSLYGDLDEDGSPEIPVGRLPVQDEPQLKTQLAKILNYKTQQLKPSWFRTVIWSGAKLYNTEMHSMTTYFTRKMLPRWLDTFIISGNPDSVFSSYPPEQPKIFLNEISDPAFMSLIVSHGSFRSVTPTIHNKKDIFLSVEDVFQLKSIIPIGPLIMLGCDSGKFDVPKGKGRSLAEAFVMHPGGPIAVISASGPTNPLTNYFFTRALAAQLEKTHTTIGDLFLDIQHKLYQEGKPSLTEMIQQDKFAQELTDAVPERERQYLHLPALVQKEQLQYILLGDPACKLKQPKPMKISIMAGEKNDTIVSGETPLGAKTLWVEMVIPQQKNDHAAPKLPKERRHERFEKANRRPATLALKILSNATWQVKLKVPATFYKSDEYMRIFAIGPEQSYYYTIIDKTLSRRSNK